MFSPPLAFWVEDGDPFRGVPGALFEACVMDLRVPALARRFIIYLWKTKREWRIPTKLAD